MIVRGYDEKDIVRMIAIWNEIVEEGVAFPQEECLTKETGLAFFASQSHCGVAEDDGKIVGGLGVIENDFHNRPDLTPNVCAVYTEESYRCRGIAGKLLNMAVEDLRSRGISPAYLVTDHTGFYERYGWEFLCMVQGDGEPDMTRMYIHR